MRLTALTIALACLTLCVASSLSLFSARHSLYQGLAAMHLAESELQGGVLSRSPGPALRRAARHVAAAREDSHSASTRLSRYAPLLGHLSWLPGLGGELSAAPPLAVLADHTSAGLGDLLTALQPALSAPHLRASAFLSSLSSRRPQLGRACAVLRQAAAERRLIPPGGSPPVAAALRGFDRQLPRLLLLCRGLDLLPSMLGYPHPRRYLIAYQDPNELRATGGYIGSMGILTLSDGAVRQEFHGSAFPHQFDRLQTSIPSPEPMALYNMEPAWLFMDSNWSPDFPTSAQLERYFLALNLHRTVDGVIDVTPQATAAILAATGPVYVPEYRRLVSAGNVVPLADYYTHWTDLHGPYHFAEPDTERMQFIGIVARRIFLRLQRLSAAQWLAVGRSLAQATARRDLLLYFVRSDEEALAHELGADGALSSTGSDYLYVVDTNLSYNKINPYLHLQISYHAGVRSNRWLQSDLTLRFYNAPAPLALGTHGAGPGAGRLGGWDDYASFVRVYVPAGALLLDQSGWTQPWSGGPAYGKTLFCGYLLVPRGSTRTVHLHYIVPPNVFLWSRGRRYRLLVQHQPGSHPDRLAVAVTHDGRTAAWTISHPRLDWSGTVSIRPRPYRPLPLPAPSPEVVAPDHWIEPHAFLAAP